MNPIGGVPTALIYTRVSSDDQAREGLSLEAQIAECRRYAAEKGWSLGSEYQDILKGTRDDRPYYQALLSDVRAIRAQGRPAVVVVMRLDRFGRRLLERVRCREELKGLGVPVHSVREGGEVSDVVANVLAAVAQEEVRVLGERVSAVVQHTKAGGWYFPGPVPWGCRLREATAEERKEGSPRSVLDIDVERAPYLREAFARAAAGASVHRVARWLQSLPPSILDGRRFAAAATRWLLTNPTYAARPRSGADDVLARPVGRWPALIDDDTFRRVQERIAGHAKMPHQASGRYLLTGLLRCPTCGARMASGGANSHQLARYRCNGRSEGAAAPARACNETATATTLDALVLHEAARLVEAFLTRDQDASAALRHAWQALRAAERTDETVARVRLLERRAQKARDRLREAARMLVDKELDRQGYELVRDEANAELDAIADDLPTLKQQRPAEALPDLDVVLARAGGWRRAVGGFDVEEQRAMLGELVERVEPVRVAFGRYEARIAWTPLGEVLHLVAEAATMAA